MTQEGFFEVASKLISEGCCRDMRMSGLSRRKSRSKALSQDALVFGEARRMGLAEEAIAKGREREGRPGREECSAWPGRTLDQRKGFGIYSCFSARL